MIRQFANKPSLGLKNSFWVQETYFEYFLCDRHLEMRRRTLCGHAPPVEKTGHTQGKCWAKSGSGSRGTGRGQSGKEQGFWVQTAEF